MARIGVLGSTGMLGSALVKVLTSQKHDVIEFNRIGRSVVEENLAIKFDATWPRELLETQLARFELDYLINAIGLIKQKINEFDKKSLLLAHEINSDFPRKLSLISTHKKIPLIQIGTDCVFSGEKGQYTESDEYDPVDVYGHTKADGEIQSTGAMTIRTSIVGKEITSSNSLLDWVLSQQFNGRVNGYTNHFWNGVTTLGFSKVLNGIIQNSLFLPGVTHLVPKDIVSKNELISIIAAEFGRRDLIIEDYESAQHVNRSLATIYPTTNSQYWTLAGYNRVPTIKELIHEFAQWCSI